MANVLKKEEGGLSGIQTLSNQLVQQAQAGEIDQNLVDQIADAINVAVNQAGEVHDKVQSEAQAAAGAMGAGDVKPAPVPTPEDAQKVYSSRPPKPDFYIPGSAEDDMDVHLPEFMKAMEAGSIRKAQQVAGGQPAFDVMFHKSCRAILNEGGFTYRNIRKIHAGAGDELDLQKSALTSASYPGVYLMRLAKLMMPVYAGLRRRFPSTTPTTGSNKATWRTQIGWANLSKANLMSVAEAAIGDAINETPTTFEATYRDIAINHAVTLKATAASRGYDDPLQIAVIQALTAVLEGEERKILGDNSAVIGKPSSLTGTAGGSGTYGNATDKFLVTALTYRGWLAGSTGGTGAVGESDGTISGVVNLSGALTVALAWPAVPGAVAYNIYYNPSSHATNKYYWKTVTANKLAATSDALPSSGNLVPASDVTANANGFEGLLSWCGLSTIYGQAINGKVAVTDQAGATLTTGASGISEIDAKLAKLWTDWQIAPSLIVASPTMVGQITDKLVALNSGAMYRIEISQERGTMAGGAFVTGYVNKFAPFADGTPRYIDIIPHPYMPNGTLAFLSETIPYPMSRESRGFALDTLVPYTYFPLAASTIQYPFAVTVSEVLECFHPAAQSAIVGVGV
jgi:hypothetical protein